MKVLFLDFDGVIALNGTLTGSCIQSLNDIVGLTKCQIVCNTAWNSQPLGVLRQILYEVGGPQILDKTDSCQGGGAPVLRWLAQHPEVTDFAIVDDSANYGADLWAYLTKVDSKTGLNFEFMQRVVQTFQRPRPLRRMAALVNLSQEAARLRDLTPWLSVDERYQALDRVRGLWFEVLAMQEYP